MGSYIIFIIWKFNPIFFYYDYGYTWSCFYSILFYFVSHDLSLLPLVFYNSKFHLIVILKFMPYINELNLISIVPLTLQK